MRFPLRLAIGALACAAAVGPVDLAWGQTKTQGSPLQSPANYEYGCETRWLPDHNSGQYQPHDHGPSSCTLIQTGTTTEDTFLVPGNGTVTRAWVKAGPNPAPVSIATVRRFFKPNQQGQMEYTCCFGVSQTPPVALQPNEVKEIPVNFLVSTKQPENGQTGWWDIVAVNVDQHAAGQTLPISDLGDNPNQGPRDMPSAWWQYPKTAPNDNNISEWFASNFEVLMRYEWTACTNASAARVARAAQPCGGTTPPPGGGTTPPPGGGTTPPGGGTTPPAQTPITTPVKVESRKLNLKGRKVKVALECVTASPCVGSVRLRTRGNKPRTLAKKRIALTAGRTSTVTLSLSRRNLRRVKGGRTKVRLQVDLGSVGKVRRDLTLTRRR